MLLNRTSCAGDPSKFQNLGGGPDNEIESLLKRKFENWRHPHVINANTPQICVPIFDYPIVFFATTMSQGQNI